MAGNYYKLQENIAHNITKAYSNFKKAPKERKGTLSYVATKLETLEDSWKEFSICHRKIILETKKEDYQASSYCKDDVYEITEECYVEYKSVLKDYLIQLKPTPSSNSSEVSNNSDKEYKLPKIEIPKFSGTYSEWASFRDSFRSMIHKNSNIDNVQKLHYLKGSLSGDAAKLLNRYPITADNYAVCWAQLEGRYDNKQFLANSLLSRLFSQKPLTSATVSSVTLIDLLDTTQECLSQLESLGVIVKTWDIMIIFLISQKLDPASREIWEQKVTESSEELPTMAMFEKFLKNRSRSTQYKDKPDQEPNSITHIVNHVVCIFCNENHKVANCKKFAHKTNDERRSFAQTNHLCFNCLNTEHSVYECKLSTRCRLCKKKHHTLLHPKALKPVNGSVQAGQANKSVVTSTTVSSLQCNDGQSPSTSDVSNITSCYLNAPSQVLLATALVNAKSCRNGTSVVLRSLLDQGSQASFVTESAVQMLGLKKLSEPNLISGLGGDRGSTVSSKSIVLLKIQSRLDPSFILSVKAHVLDKLTCFLPRNEIDAVSSLFATLELADPSFGCPNKIDLLLGAEVYSQILLDGLVKDSPGSVIAQKTKLGWILSGTVTSVHNPSDYDHSKHCNIVSMHITDDNDLLKKFWEMEAEPSRKVKHLTVEEQKCEDLFTKTTRREPTGRYVVKLPFKSKDPLCKYGNSREIARKRFLMLESRLIRNPCLKIEYSNVIQEYLNMGHMEAVDDPYKTCAVYLPHHAVVRQDKSTSKVRVVFDASCTDSNGVSLNSDLMVGPPLQADLRHLVMRWRCYPISIVADIVKMYRQIRVSDEDVDFQRIYWRQNPGEELQHLRLRTVTFGTSSAPYLAVRSLQQLAADEGAQFPLAASRVLNEFYMDDLMSGCYSVEEGVLVHSQLKELLNRGGFPLQKWASNNNDLMKAMDDGMDKLVTELVIKHDEVMRILGLTWHREADVFQCTVNLPPLQLPVTKRRVVSDIARLFDPLGWLAPAITMAKVFIQRLWLSGIEWDSELPSSLLDDWLTYRRDLPRLSEIRIPRWIHTGKHDKILELHGFSDASNVAFAAVVYARVIDPSGFVHVSLISSKTKVAPIKQVSIPRLELCGAVLLAKLLTEVAEILKVSKQNLHAWTDSSIVLAWLSNHPNRWQTFVANRVSEILTLTEATQWSHVASQDNPADCASRGVLPSECTKLDIWNCGPQWLHLKEIKYSKGNLPDTNLEEKKSRVKVHTLTCMSEGVSLLTRFSSLRRLQRVLSWCRRAYLPRSQTKPVWLTAKELCEVMTLCIKVTQGQYLTSKDLEIRKSKFASLNPFKDVNGIWRVGGRLQKSELPEDRKHPVLIPRDSHLAKLIIADAHERTLHGGPQLTINYIHSKYWIVNLRNLVKSYIHKCVTCLRYSSRAITPLMGQLPSARITADRPFRNSGVDYAGPIAVRTSKGRGHRSTKGYICLFVCMVTRAVHLEVVSDLTSAAFIAAFKRFVARRGHCAELWSDNATTFVGADRELKALVESEKSIVARDITEWLATNGTNWHRIPPYSPNFGGLWEAGIKSTKNHLKRVIGESTLTFEELTTVLAQIEACLNSRPLTKGNDSSLEDPFPLTPGHFLVGEALVLVPENNYETSNVSSLRRWQLTQRMVQLFWRKWSQEYLTQFLQRYKWKELIAEPEIGDVVLVKEDGLPPSRWLYGVITDKHTGSDDVTRVVSLRSKGTIIKRPVSKIVKLPVNDD